MVNMLLKPLMASSFMGAASGVVLLVSGSALEALSSYYPVVLIACIATTFVGLVYIQLSLRRKFPGQSMAKILLGESPRWVWQVAVVFALIGFAVWLKLGGMTHEPAEGAAMLFLVAISLVVCPSGFASFYSCWLQRHKLNAAKA